MAYIDPGSGSMAVQILLSLAIGLIVAMRRYIATMFSFLAFWKRK